MKIPRFYPDDFYESPETEKEAIAFAIGEGYDSSNATAVKPIPTRFGGVNAITSIKE